MILADVGNIALTSHSDADTVANYAEVNFDSRKLQSLKVADLESSMGQSNSIDVRSWKKSLKRKVATPPV